MALLGKRLAGSCVLVALSAALGLFVGLYTRPAGGPTASERPQAALSEGKPASRDGGKAPGSSGDPGPAVDEQLRHERAAIERSVAKWLAQGEQNGVPSSSPAALHALYEAKDRIRAAVHLATGSASEARAWLQLGVRVAEALGDVRTVERYRSELAKAASASPDGRGTPEERRFLRAAELARQGSAREAATLIEGLQERLRQSQPASPFIVLGGSQEEDREALMWALQCGSDPATALAKVEAALKELRPRASFLGAWLALKLQPDSDDCERLRLAQAISLSRLGRRQEALKEFRRLTRTPWDRDVSRRAFAWSRCLELELRLPAEKLAAMDASERKRMEQARWRRRLREQIARKKELEDRTPKQ